MGEQNAQNARRSQRVLLQVSVLLRAQVPGGDNVQVQAFTSVVNAHGGLLDAPLKVTVNQKFTLSNPRSGREVGCRVVRVEGPRQECFSIAFEFDRSDSLFWPITFPPEDWELTEAMRRD